MRGEMRDGEATTRPTRIPKEGAPAQAEAWGGTRSAHYREFCGEKRPKAPFWRLRPPLLSGGLRPAATARRRRLCGRQREGESAELRERSRSGRRPTGDAGPSLKCKRRRWGASCGWVQPVSLAVLVGLR